MPESPSVFTIEECNALVPRLRALMEAQMGRRTEIERRLDELASLVGKQPEKIQIDERDPPRVRELKRELGKHIEVYRTAWAEVEAMGAVLKDPRMGLVDFYGWVDGRLVCLCWKYGEEAVMHYHGLDEGFAGRKPIEAHLRRRHLN